MSNLRSAAVTAECGTTHWLKTCHFALNIHLFLPPKLLNHLVRQFLNGKVKGLIHKMHVSPSTYDHAILTGNVFLKTTRRKKESALAPL